MWRPWSWGRGGSPSPSTLPGEAAREPLARARANAPEREDRKDVDEDSECKDTGQSGSSCASDLPGSMPGGSWFGERWLRTAALYVLTSGRVPRHVAFIMDGNRRFARKNHLACAKGHAMGFEKLRETLQWCMDLGVKEVTVYAFSLANFKRPPEEVQALMALAKDKFTQMLERGDLIDKHGVCVRVFGDVARLPHDVQVVIARAVTGSCHNTKAVLNVCFPYTSTHEMTQVATEIAQGVGKGQLLLEDVTEELVDQALYTGRSPKLDLLIRTSGEVRLSDFLLWQSSFSCLYFSQVLWPEFTFWELLRCLLHYQRHCSETEGARQAHEQQCRQLRVDDIKTAAAALVATDKVADEGQDVASKRCLGASSTRVTKFLDQLHDKRLAYFWDLVT
eukprot:m.29524 g.29524  ORF g.29524 m.29524 type:complete len:393 (-) comp9174_c0_seq2:215-1393(-)